MIREKGNHRYRVIIAFKVREVIVVAKNYPQAKNKAVRNLAARNFGRLVDHKNTLVNKL